MATAKKMTERETSAALLDGFSKREALEFAAKQVVKRGGTPSEKFWRTVHRTISEHGRVKAKKTVAKAKSKSAPKSKAKAAPSGDRGAKVWAWLKKSDMELTYDAKLWTPAEWRKHGSDPGNAVFVITTEGPLYQLVNGHYDAPAATKVDRDFNKMLKSLGLWYDMGSAVELYFYDK